MENRLVKRRNSFTTKALASHGSRGFLRYTVTSGGLGECLSREKLKAVLKEGEAMDNKKTEMKLSSKEKKIIEIIRSTEYGRLKIMVQEGQPVRVEEVTKSIKL